MKYRMYSMVLRQLNPMQKGVQSLHAVVEYGRSFGWFESSIYNQWADCDKTMIILDAGVSTDLKDAMMKLDEFNISYASFKEPDLYNEITAIAFLADERIWDTKTYPDYETYMEEQLGPYNDNYINIKNRWISCIGCESEKEAEQLMAIRNFIFSKRLSM